jgi:hypothetical protein
MPVKQAEMSSWRRVVRVGEVAAGGCRVVVDVLDFIDIFEMTGGCWRSKRAARKLREYRFPCGQRLDALCMPGLASNGRGKLSINA